MEKLPEFEIEIWSTPEREELVCDLWLGELLLARMFIEGGRLTVRLYNNPNSPSWTLPYEDLSDALSKAKARYAQYYPEYA
jgi:hypothetical protein